ncbi:redoxin domain-containing protein [Nocardia rhizosphaerae]|uniref:Redoxin domain-containing protein n=1 Tax=Nocardia rhizosphaerae TaxID=1691571 RepID=A0ABV8L7G5_9NOCA
MITVVCTTALLAVGCGGTDEAAPPAATTTMSVTAAEAPPQPGAPVPEQLNFTARTVDGAEFAGASLAGKPAVLWFWAPWCPTCQREAPGVAAAARANSDVRFVGVAALDQEPAMRAFVGDYDLGFFPNLADVDGQVWQKFGVTAQPAYAFVGADGEVEVWRGTLDEAELASRIAQLDRG